MLKEAFTIIDEPRTLNEVKLRKAFLALLGREPDLAGLQTYVGDLANGQSFAQVVNTIATSNERTQYVQQANGNPVTSLIIRDGDGTTEAGEAAFNTQLYRLAGQFYTVTGDMISLPYSHQIYLENKFASGNVNINPYGVAAYIGMIELNPPENSVEFSNKSAPTVFDDPNDNYTTVVNSFRTELAGKEGVTINVDDATGFYGSYYGEWELISQGTPELDPSDNTFKRSDTYGRYKYEFSIKPQGQSSTGGQRRDIVYDNNLRPKMSDVTIGFSAQGLKPSTRVYAFFGDRAVTDACTMFTQSGQGHDIISTTLTTDNAGRIRGTFTYRESDLNLDAGIYPFQLTDSTTNSDNRTTYASSLFNGLGLAGYGEDTFRTRIAQTSFNKTSAVATSEVRRVVTGTAETPGAAKSIDIIDFCFVYALGRKPSQEEKVGIYNKWVDYGIADMTVWNSIETQNTISGAATTGTEIWLPEGWPRNDMVLSYVDRAVSVVANGTDSADLRSKYLAAAAYPYGTWNWIYIKDEVQWPATINYMQFMNLADPGSSLTPPWTTDLAYSSLNENGIKVLNALRNFVFDVRSLNNGMQPSDWQGTIGFAARFYGIIAYDQAGNVVEGQSAFPTSYVKPKTPQGWQSNVETITTVWSVLGTDCQQPQRIVVGAAPADGALSSVKITLAGQVSTPYGYLLTNKTSGNVETGPNGGGGNGPALMINQVAYPATLVPGAVYQTATAGGVSYTQVFGGGANAHSWAASGDGGWGYIATQSVQDIGTMDGSPKLTGQPYQLMGIHYGNYTWQVVVGIQSGQTGNTVNVPVKVVIAETGASYDTWIPGTAAAFWDDGTDQQNYMDIYTGYKGGDPLNLAAMRDSGQPFTLKIIPRDAAATPASPVGGSSAGYIADQGVNDTGVVYQAG
jgi:hypothetical protein